MKIFIDFDDVIFNTKKFKRDFRNMFIAHGVSGAIFDKYYNDPNDARAIKTFDPWRQIGKIHAELNIDAAKLTRLVDDYILDMSPYVFEDAKFFAASFGKENICVLSFGEKEFQTRKITNSGVVSFIGKVIVTEGSKSQALAEILAREGLTESENLFFLDDRTEQIMDVKKKFPSIVTIFVKRPEGRYQEMIKEACCDYEVHNLKEAQELISKLQKNENK